MLPSRLKDLDDTRYYARYQLQRYTGGESPQTNSHSSYSYGVGDR